MNTNLERRHFPIDVCELEGRTLLSGTLPTATWIGQDGQDLVGAASTLGPDGIQDIQVTLAGLPADLSITQAVITGYGGGQWTYDSTASGPYAIALVRAPGATTADLYFEPYQVETGRAFNLVLTYSDGSSANIWFQGGVANPDLWMPGDDVGLRWLGQDGQDWTGPGAAVGPDGFQDVDLAISNLQTDLTVQSATLTASGGESWAYGTNPDLLSDAELFTSASDPTKADLYFSPETNLQGQTLSLTIDYSNGRTATTTVTAGATDPTLAMPAPTPVAVNYSTITASWVGQDGQDLTGPGDVHVKVSGLPAGQSVASAELSDGTQTTWEYSAAGPVNQLNVLPLAFRVSATDPTRADVDFPPIRDESNTTLTLRLVLANGTDLVTTFAGGSADPGLRAAGIAPTTVVASPGDDLNTLANEYGTVHLTAGTYDLSQPLVLNQPVTITADPGVTLLFSQPADATPWTAAIKINASHTTLNGFAVRFAGPVVWNQNVSYSPAVIGTTDNFDPSPVQNALRVDITLTDLNLMSPPASSSWELAPSLIRVVSAQNGVISDNVLMGGTTEFIGGPWQVVGNTYEGTVADTYTSTAFAGHYTHDLVLANNTAEPVGDTGKTYRFLVLTQSGIGDVVQNNMVVGIGPMDTDTEPNPNATEIILTEAYNINYEGAPAAIADDDQVVQIPSVLSGAVYPGDVLAILAGPQAGQWRQIVQVINPTTFLLSGPIDPGTTAVSVAQGFVDESFVGNTVNATGSSTAADLDLAGNQFGVQVLDNTLIGGNMAFYISAYPTEGPLSWGWTHAPVLGAVISGNTIEDSVSGAVLDVDHGGEIKSNTGRVYLSATLTDNTVIWSSSYVAQRAQGGTTGQLSGLTVGVAPSNDPGELVVTASGNQAQGPADVVSGATLTVVSATVNGQAEVDQGTALPALTIAAPTALALVDDDGISATDGRTGDAHLRFDTVPLAVGYEYSLTGVAGSYQPVGSNSSFLPQGLVAGFNTVYVRAYDADGDRGPDALILFLYDPTGAAAGSSTGATLPDTYEYRIANTGAYIPIGTSMILTPSQEADGPPTLQILLVNSGSPSAPLTVSPPPSSTGGGSSSPAPTPTAGTTNTTTGGGTSDPNSGGSPGDSGGSTPQGESSGSAPTSAEETSSPGSAPVVSEESATGSGSSVAAQTAAPVLTRRQKALALRALEAARVSHGPAVSRHPDPFRRTGPTVSALGIRARAIGQGHPHAAATAHTHAARDIPRAMTVARVVTGHHVRKR